MDPFVRDTLIACAASLVSSGVVGALMAWSNGKVLGTKLTMFTDFTREQLAEMRRDISSAHARIDNLVLKGRNDAGN